MRLCPIVDAIDQQQLFAIEAKLLTNHCPLLGRMANTRVGTRAVVGAVQSRRQVNLFVDPIREWFLTFGLTERFDRFPRGAEGALSQKLCGYRVSGGLLQTPSGMNSSTPVEQEKCQHEMTC